MNRRWIHAGGLALVTLAIVWLAGEASIAALMLAGGGGLLLAVLGAAPLILLVLSWLLWRVGAMAGPGAWRSSRASQPCS